MRLPSHPYFLRIYSGLLTVTFVLTVSLGLERGDFALHRVSASEQQESQHPSFDQIRCIASMWLSRMVLHG
jgi:hypothetical protein